MWQLTCLSDDGRAPQEGVILRDNPGDSSGHKVSMMLVSGLEVNCSIYQNAKPTAVLIKTVHCFVFVTQGYLWSREKQAGK